MTKYYIYFVIYFEELWLHTEIEPTPCVFPLPVYTAHWTISHDVDNSDKMEIEITYQSSYC